MSLPWVPFDFTHYMRSTPHFTTKARGAHLMLSIYYLWHGALPDDDQQRMTICKLHDLREWQEIAAIITAPTDDPYAFTFLPDWTCPYLDRMRSYKRFSYRFNANVLRGPCVRRAIAPDWQIIRRRIFERDGYVCRYCKDDSAVDLECDHIVPVVLGGGDDDANLATSCRPCNRSKGAKTLEEWGVTS